MKTFSRLLLLAPLALAGACVDNKASLEMVGVCAVPDTCTFSGTCGAFYLGENVVDFSRAERLWLFLEVRNQLPDNSNPDIGRVNTNDAFIQEVLVTYRGLDIPSARYFTQKGVPASGTTVASVIALPEAQVAAIDPLVPGGGTAFLVAQVRLRGVLGDTSEFETDPFDIPIRACDGCLDLAGCPTLGDLLFICPFGPNGAQEPVSYTCNAP